MNTILTILGSFLGAGGIAFGIELWIRRREARAVEAERRRVAEETERIKKARDVRIETGEAIIEGTALEAHEQIKADAEAHRRLVAADPAAALKALADRTARPWR